MPDDFPNAMSDFSTRHNSSGLGRFTTPCTKPLDSVITKSFLVDLDSWAKEKLDTINKAATVRENNLCMFAFLELRVKR